MSNHQSTQEPAKTTAANNGQGQSNQSNGPQSIKVKRWREFLGGLKDQFHADLPHYQAELDAAKNEDDVAEVAGSITDSSYGDMMTMLGCDNEFMATPARMDVIHFHRHIVQSFENRLRMDFRAKQGAPEDVANINDERGSIQLAKPDDEPTKEQAVLDEPKADSHYPFDVLSNLTELLIMAARYTDEKQWVNEEYTDVMERNRKANKIINDVVEHAIKLRATLLMRQSLSDHSTEINVTIEHLQQAYNYLWPERNAPHHRSFEERIARSMECIGFAINGLNEIKKKKGASNGRS